MKIYLAGPDVFRPDCLTWAESARRLVADHGHQALIPLDSEVTTAEGIYRANISLIAEADALLANLNPFRGSEPDSGTVFEIGYAIALGKRVVGYLEDTRSQTEKLVGDDRCKSRIVDHNGFSIENFGLPVNLMLGIPCEVVEGGLLEALKALKA